MEQKDFYYYLSWILNRPLTGPRRLQIDLTHRCNLDCKMCSVQQYASTPNDELKKEEIFTLITQAKKMGVGEVIFTGGEPFLYKDIFDVCSFCQQQRLVSVVVTNGTLIKDVEFARRIVDSEVSCVSISIDGLKDAHDFFRGAGNFEKTVQGLKYLVQAKADLGKGPSINVGCIVSDKNVLELEPLASYLESLGAEFMYLLPLMPDNTAYNKQGSGSTKMQEDYLRTLERVLLDLRKEYAPDRKKMNLKEGVPLELLLKYYRQGIREKDWICYAAFDNVFITLCNPERKSYLQPYVRFCMEFGGNVRERSLRDIWYSWRSGSLRRKLKKCKAPCLQSCFYGVMPNRAQRCLNLALRHL